MTLEVWTLAPTAGDHLVNDVAVDTYYSFPWSSAPSAWTKRGRLLVISTTEALKGNDSVSLELFPQKHRNELGEVITDIEPLVAGQWCVVTDGNIGASLQLSAVRFAGYLDPLGQTTLAAQTGNPETIDGFGTVTMYGIGQLLDQAPIPPEGWAWPDQTEPYGVSMSSPPSANYSVGDGSIIGNLTFRADEQADQAVVAGGLGVNVPLFARAPSDCGTDPLNYWTRYELLKHIAAYIWNSTSTTTDGLGLPDVTISTQSSEIRQALDDNTKPEVFDLRNLTIAGALDLLIPSSLGLTYIIKPIENNGQLRLGLEIISATDLERYNTPTVDIDDTHNIAAVNIIEQSTSTYDRITVEGAPILFCGTVGYHDFNLLRGWSDDQQARFATGSEAPGATDAQHRQRRAEPDLIAVGTRFVIGSLHETDIRSQEFPITGAADLSSGTGYSGIIRPLIPQVNRREAQFGGESRTYDLTTVDSVSTDNPATNLYLNHAISRAPFLPTARLAVDIPWPAGVEVKASGTLKDTRDAEAIARPELLKPRLFYFDQEADPQWLNLLNDDRGEIPRIDIPSGGNVVSVRYKNQEQLLGAWVPSGQTPPMGQAAYEGQLLPELDWQKLALTIAIESDQRISETRDRLANGANRRHLVIKRPDLQCWIVNSGTILGVADDDLNIPRATNRAYVTRNDWDTAAELADLLADFYFTTRRAITFTAPNNRLEADWLTLGAYIGNITDTGPRGHNLAQTITARSSITSITRTYRGPANTLGISVTTSLPVMPAGITAGQGGSVSPSGGGAVSLTMGGTLAQSLQRTQNETRQASQDQRIRNVIPPRGGAAAERLTAIRIGDGNTLFTGLDGFNDISGLAIPTTGVTAVPTATPAFTGGSYPVGLVAGRILSTSEVVWVGVKIGLAPDEQSDLIASLPTNSVILSRISVPVDVTDAPGTSAPVYLPYLDGMA